MSFKGVISLAVPRLKITFVTVQKYSTLVV